MCCINSLSKTGYDGNKNSPNSSPACPSASPTPLAFSFLSNSPQSHSGYSWSSLATGASLPFIYPNPLKSVPAFTLLRTAGGVDAGGDDSRGNSGERAGEGANGVEKGCAAEVEVAGGGSGF